MFTFRNLEELYAAERDLKAANVYSNFRLSTITHPAEHDEQFEECRLQARMLNALDDAIVSLENDAFDARCPKDVPVLGTVAVMP